MKAIPLSALASPLISVVRAAWPYFRRLHAERQAGRMPIAGGDDLLVKNLDVTLVRLRGSNVDDAWWRNFLASIEHSYVAPDFLSKPALLEWLGDERVQSDIKALARSKIMGSDAVDEDTWKNLRGSYAEFTGENEHLADGPIDVVITVLAVGYFGGMSSGEQLVAGMVQVVSQQVVDLQSSLESQLKSTGLVANTGEIFNGYVKSNLIRILRRRSLEPDLAREEICALAGRVLEGNLCAADFDIRAEVLCWAARLHAIIPVTRNAAIEYRRQLLEIRPKSDTRVIDALIRESSGDLDGALRDLRDIDDPDGHTVLFLFLHRTRNYKAAVEWFDGLPFRNDVNFFTGLGWSQIAVVLAQAGRWEEAVDCLAVARGQASEWPELTFVEGMVRAAMLLPADLRWNALATSFFPPERTTIEGNAADRLRASANEQLVRAEEQLADLELNDKVQAAKDVRLWLRLTDPRPEVATVAIREVEDGMQDMKRAINLLPFALVFDISFDTTRIKRFLTQRESLGGLSNPELIAEYLLAESTMAPRDLADYLEREEKRFARVINKVVLIGKRIEALVKDNQLARARHLLEERCADIDEPVISRLQMMIDIHAGADGREQLERFYRETNSIDDLRNLISHLGHAQDWAGLRPLLEEQFRRGSTVENARKVVECMQRVSRDEEDRILVFLNANSDLVARDPILRSAKAWALFLMGNWRDAKAINDVLLFERKVSADLLLDMNLALQSGDWEHFGVIVDREWDRRSDHSPEILMRLAKLAAESDKSPRRALELARISVSKAPDDPQILVNAYGLAVQLGEDESADPGWIAHAAEISNDAGPVKRVDLRTIVEKIAPANRDRERRTNDGLSRGEIPLCIAADVLNLPLARVLLDIPRRNADQPDGRRRVIVPIVFGGRQPVDMKKEWTVGFDITSLMVLEHLGMLGMALGAFQHVVIAPDTMMVLLNEHRSVRFHQPSRVRKAEEIISLIDGGRLRDTSPLPEPPPWLSEEVGRDLAQLLEAARVSGGRVVHPYPIYKLSTFMEQEADLRDYTELILPTKGFARLLLEKSYIDSSMFERAWKYLSVHDKGRDTAVDSAILGHPLYLDDLGVNYLQQAGLLRGACGCGLDFRVHHLMRKELGALIDATGEGEKLAAELNGIREILHDALEKGNISFLPRHGADGEEIEETDLHRAAPTLAQFLRNAGQCDAICVDDRFLNRHSTMTDRSGRTVTVVCILDLLRHFVGRGMVDARKKHEILHGLRKAGFALVPVEPDELEARLYSARDEQDRFAESYELRILRQSLSRIRSLDVVRQPEETSFLDILRLGCVMVIRRLWEDEKLPVDEAVTMSDWLWRNVSPSPLDWGRTARDRVGVMSPPDAFALHIALLLKPMLKVEGERHKAFRDWVEREVLDPLLPANAGLVDGAAARIQAEITAWSVKYGDDERSSG